MFRLSICIVFVLVYGDKKKKKEKRNRKVIPGLWCFSFGKSGGIGGGRRQRGTSGRGRL